MICAINAFKTKQKRFEKILVLKERASPQFNYGICETEVSNIASEFQNLFNILTNWRILYISRLIFLPKWDIADDFIYKSRRQSKWNNILVFYIWRQISMFKTNCTSNNWIVCANLFILICVFWNENYLIKKSQSANRRTHCACDCQSVITCHPLTTTNAIHRHPNIKVCDVDIIYKWRNQPMLDF